MTIEQLNQKLFKRIEDNSIVNLITEAAVTVQDEMAQRIFVRAENVAGKVATPADYSTKELWIERDELPREAGSQVGKRKTPIKTRYFKGGWKEVKQATGEPNYTLTGDLASDFRSPLVSVGQRVILKLKRKENIGKVRGLNAKYGKTFALTKTERQLFIDIVKDGLLTED